MASITIRQLNPDTKARLADQAARRGRSLEAEVRDILDTAAAARGSPDDLEPFGSWMVRITRPGADDLADSLERLRAERRGQAINAATFD